MKDSYAYAVARCKVHETRLLSKQDFQDLILQPGYREALQFLVRKGFPNVMHLSKMLDLRQKEMLGFIEEQGDLRRACKIFRLESDFHNLKAGIRIKESGESFDHYNLLSDGDIDPETMRKAIENNHFALLTDELERDAKKAEEILHQTHDARQFDCYLDRAMLRAVNALGSRLRHGFLQEYIKAYTAMKDIKAAYRCCLANEEASMILNVLQPCEGLDVEKLSLSAARDVKSLCTYLSYTDYADAANAISVSGAALDAWCSRYLYEQMEKEKENSFGLSPIFAYYYFVKQETRDVRRILLLKKNQIGIDFISERMWR